MSGWLDGPVLNVLQKELNASNLRQQVLANNLANIDTPHFKRSDVDFQAVLNAALGETSGDLPLKLTSQRHIPGVAEASGSSGIVTDQTTSLRNDGNNVDVDREMSNVAENGLYYDSLTRTISSQLALLQMVMK
jgi:flagellar basal-body rod protein FlgB